MVKTTLTLFGAGLLGLVMSGPVHAQEVATLVLQNGERPSGELVDLNASGFTLRIGGQDRQFARSNVRSIEFVVGALAPDAQARANAGQSLVILRSGQVVDGQLNDIGGTHPLRLTFDTPGGSRDFSSNDVYQVYLGGAPIQSAAAPAPAAPAAAQVPASPNGGRPSGGAITVPANQAWTDTGITVTRGEQVQFAGSGAITVSPGASSGVSGSRAGTVRRGRYPVGDAPAGTLIARIDNGAPFQIGSNTQPMTMATAGRLFLGVNDDQVADNNGAFSVIVTTQTGQTGQPGQPGQPGRTRRPR